MDFNLFWKTIIVFNLSFPIIWICFYTFRASFMNDGDFVAPGENARGSPNAKDNNDSTLSMAGRSLIFLISIISSLILAMLFFIYYLYFIKPTYKCVKGKNNLKCKKV